MDASIVVCTCGRPKPLQRLLASIRQQSTSFSHELIVVNNLPQVPVTLGRELGPIRLIVERRSGLSYARNAGIRAARGSVVVLVDDDIEVPPGWLDALVEPIFGENYDAVFGPTLPLKVETEAERLFEALGGHGHCAERREFGPQWLAARRLSLPIWQAGGLGNSAIRRAIFEDPRVGLMEEMLGAGSPAGSSEDLYWMYLTMGAGYRILHEPAAAVRHAHRETMAELERQLCDYRRGEVCFCLLAADRHGDLRALGHLLFWVPYWRAGQLLRELVRRVKGERQFPLRLMAREWLAYASGPGALRASRSRVRAVRARHDSAGD